MKGAWQSSPLGEVNIMKKQAVSLARVYSTFILKTRCQITKSKNEDKFTIRLQSKGMNTNSSTNFPLLTFKLMGTCINIVNIKKVDLVPVKLNIKHQP
jgi:hypothetical protein